MKKAVGVMLILFACAGCDPKDIPEDYLAESLQEVLAQERARFDSLRQEVEHFQNLFRLQTAALCVLGCGLGIALYRLYRPARRPQ